MGTFYETETKFMTFLHLSVYKKDKIDDVVNILIHNFSIFIEIVSMQLHEGLSVHWVNCANSRDNLSQDLNIITLYLTSLSQPYYVVSK